MGGGGGALLGRSAATTFGFDESCVAQSTAPFSTNVTIEFGPSGVRQEGPNATSAEPCFTSSRSPATRDAPDLTSAKPAPRDKSTAPVAEVRRAEETGAHTLFACVSHRIWVLTSSAKATPGKANAQMSHVIFRIGTLLRAVCSNVNGYPTAGNGKRASQKTNSCAVARRSHQGFAILRSAKLASPLTSCSRATRAGSSSCRF